MCLRDKEVIVIDEDGQEMKIKQFCQQILDNDLALISGTNYDNEYIQIHRRKNTPRQSFPGKSSGLMRIYSAPLCDKQSFCGTGFVTDRNPGPLNRISILFPTPAQKLFVYIEGGKILKSDICF